MPAGGALLLHLLVLAAVLAAAPLSAADRDPLAVLLQRSTAGTIEARDCPSVAETFAGLANGGRENGAGAKRLQQIRQAGDSLHKACRKARRELEADAGEDELALETLYRSQSWYEINRALASFRYWQAWLDLSLSQSMQDSGPAVTELSQARRGFEAASLYLLYPGLVYGSWLGLAYVDQLEGNEASARRRLDALAEVLKTDPDNPLREIVESERLMMDLRAGKAVAQSEPTQAQPLTAASARLVEEQAFRLLEQHRQQKAGAIAAARKLRRLIGEGFMDDRLFIRLLDHVEEIVGQDLGALSLLLEAEYAYKYQKYNTTVLKFRSLMAVLDELPPLSLDVYRYHYAVSLYQIDLPRDAQAVLQELDQRPSLGTELRASLRKLDFILAEERYRTHQDIEATNALRTKAQAFIASNAGDADLPTAWLALARITDDEQLRQDYLSKAGDDKRLQGAVQAVELDMALADFLQANTRREQAAMREAAEEVLQLLDGLPRKQREQVDTRLLQVQMLSVATPMAQQLDGEITELLAHPDLNQRQASVLYWSQLRMLDAREDSAGLSALFASAEAVGRNPARDQECYAFLQQLQQDGRHALLASLSQHWLPRLSAQPPLHRQVWAMRINALSSSGQQQAAVSESREMVQLFSDSGDAWQLLAELSAHTGDAFAAERAWAHIASAEPPGSPRWLEVSTQRLQLLLDMGSTPRACDLAQNMAIYNHRLEADDRHWLHKTMQNCPPE